MRSQSNPKDTTSGLKLLIFMRDFAPQMRQISLKTQYCVSKPVSSAAKEANQAFPIVIYDPSFPLTFAILNDKRARELLFASF